MLNAALSFLNRGTEKPKQICRICRDLAEIRTEGLCTDCAHVKARIHLADHSAAGRRRYQPTNAAVYEVRLRMPSVRPANF